MKSIFFQIRKHPVSVIFYLLQTIICLRLVILNLDKNSAIHGPDGGLPSVFMLLVNIVFTVVIILNAIFRKNDKKFYLWLSFVMIVQVFFLFYIAW